MPPKENAIVSFLMPLPGMMGVRFDLFVTLLGEGGGAGSKGRGQLNTPPPSLSSPFPPPFPSSTSPATST